MSARQARARAQRLEQQQRMREYRLFRRTAAFCRRTYLRRRNVLDVGVGLRFARGAPSGDELCVQFCVRRKLKRPGAARLPRFVFARRADGALDRRRRLRTDVVPLHRPRFACCSGTGLEAPGETGTLALLFRNRADAKLYALTCAHVAGDLLVSPPASPDLFSACCPKGRFATTLVNSTQRQGVVDWDVALARVEARCDPQQTLCVQGSARPLRRLQPAAEIVPGMAVECAAARSGSFVALVASDARSLQLELDGAEFLVRNLFLIAAQPVPGDSGALVYAEDRAVGMLVGIAGDDAGSASGWGLFQPLEGALADVRRRCDFALDVPLGR